MKIADNSDGRFSFGEEEVKYDQDNKERGMSERWDQPSRDLQTEGELADRARHVGHDI
jgi:hypothetical protein